MPQNVQPKTLCVIMIMLGEIFQFVQIYSKGCACVCLCLCLYARQ